MDSTNGGTGEEPQAPTWGLMTGWRMIAQDVINDLDGDNEASIRSEVNRTTNTEADDSVEDTLRAMQSSRLKSVTAKSGENFYMDYQMMEEIGSGAFGTAIKAKRRSDQETVVVKELIGRKMTAKDIQEAQNEVKVLAHLHHPNIVRYYDFYSGSGRMHIVMEFCEEGDLSSYLKSRDGQLLEENEIMMKFVQVCLALDHTHSQGILHRDLKTQNVFLSAHGILKLGDFGISRIMEGEQSMARSMVGTPYYLSPEICEDKPYGPKSDVWSLGCVLYELCMLKHAFEGQSLPVLILKILSGTVPEIPSKYSTHLTALVKRLLSKNPDQRPSIAEILNFDYVRTHLQHYGAHIHYTVVRRRESFQRSLEPFELPSPADHEIGMMRHRRSTEQSLTGAIHRKSRPFGVDQQELDQWVEIEDDTTFEIAPYRYYTQAEDVFLNKLNLRSVQTESFPLPETPLAAEFSANIAKITAFKRKVFGDAARGRHRPSSHHRPRVSKGKEVMAPVFEYVSDEEHHEMVFIESEEESDTDTVENMKDMAQGLTSVVSQIQNIMKAPSVQIGASWLNEVDLLPPLDNHQEE